ncbi:MAG: hypothetical protein ACPGEF_03515, partial [Endozoicomonas sp.]
MTQLNQVEKTMPINYDVEYPKLQRELAQAEQAIETKNIQLSICSALALANTASSAEKVREDIPSKYRCGAVNDVCDAIDHEISLREQLAEARQALKELKKEDELPSNPIRRIYQLTGRASAAIGDLSREALSLQGKLNDKTQTLD